MFNDTTPALGLPLPHPANELADDVLRLRVALTAVDNAVTNKADLVDGKVAAGQLPSFVDDVIEVETFLDLPVTGEKGKIYVVLDDDMTYRWGGSTYVVISASPGSTDDVPEGALNKYFTEARARAAQNIATDSQLGLVKVGNGLSVDPDGLLSLDSASMAFSIVNLNVTSNGQTNFLVPGGYTASAIEVLLNGVELKSGEDYTATDGANLVLASGVNTTDWLSMRRWSVFQVADALKKSDLATQSEMETALETAPRAMSPVNVRQSIDYAFPNPSTPEIETAVGTGRRSWSPVNIGSLVDAKLAKFDGVGSVYIGTKKPTIGTWLDAGKVYLQASYPALFAELGFLYDGSALVATQRTMPTNSLWNCIAYGSGSFVAMADGTTVAATSTDGGVTWTQRTLPVSAKWRSIAYGNGVFVAVAGGGTNTTIAITSTDGGVTWTQRTLPASSTWSSIAYGNGVFVAVAGGNATSAIAATSTDGGVTWTQRTLPVSASWNSVAYGNGVFVAVQGTGTTAAFTLPIGSYNLSTQFVTPNPPLVYGLSSWIKAS